MPRNDYNLTKWDVKLQQPDDLPMTLVLAALESLRRRMLIERGPDRPTFTLQPVILEFVTDQLVEAMGQEIVDGQPKLLHSLALMQASAKEYVGRSQQHMIATPLLEQLVGASGAADEIERQLLTLLSSWREKPRIEQGYGPGNVINLLRLLRGELRGLDLARLAIRQAELQGVEMQDSSLAGASLQDTLFTEAVDAITAVAISSTGDYWAAASRRGEVLVWTAAGLTLHRSWRAHTDMVWILTFSPDGRTLASASWDGTVKLWELPSGRLRQTLEGHTDRVVSLVWSPDGHTLASASRDRTIWLLDVERSSYRAALVGHSAGVNRLAFTPDSRSILSGSQDDTLRVWDVASRQCLRIMQGYATSLYDVDWSPDGTHLVSGGSDTLVTIFDLSGATPPRVLRGHSGVVFGVGWSSEGGYLASCEWDNQIRLWDPRSGVCLQVLEHPDDPGNYFHGLAWSPDGQRLASATYRRGVQVFEMRAQGQAWAAREFPTWIRQVAWRPDGALVAGGGDDGTVYVWDAADGTLMARLAGHGSMVTRVDWSPAGTRLASGSGGKAGGELFVWDAQRGELIQKVEEHAWMVYAVAWGSSEDVLVSGGADGALRWWDVGSGTCMRVRQAHQGTVQALRRSPDGTVLASCGDDGAIVLWDLRSGEYLQTLRRDRPYERMDITGLTGISAAQRASLLALGAVERSPLRAPALTSAPPTDADQPTRDDQKLASSLPSQPASLIGRSAELAALAGLLADPACRLLTLLGPGGIGKTRPALAVAAAHTAAFSDGVAFVALASIGTPSQIVSAIGETLGLSFVGQSDPTAHLLGELRERRMLLVLDTFEHLLARVDLLADILAHAPHLTILATSRERLNLQAEWLFDVDGLAYPPEGPLASAAPRSLAAQTDYSAVELFVLRARLVHPELVPDEATLTTILQICQHVAGMPLAIELAAAAMRTLPLAAIERQIRAHLDVLATTLRDVPARHRSMRAVFDHSWQLLSEGERALFSRLAVFRGGWTAEAAEAVCAQGKKQKAKGETENSDEPLLPFTFSLLPLLTALVDKSLVRSSSAESRVLGAHADWKGAAEPRFAMLEPLREYALEQLAARGEAFALQRAHASYYLALVKAIAAQWDTPSAQALIKQLDREHDNLRAALRWVCDGGDHTIGLRLAGALRKFWQSRGLISEGRAWLAVLLARADTTVDAAGLVARLSATQAAPGWLPISTISRTPRSSSSKVSASSALWGSQPARHSCSSTQRFRLAPRATTSRRSDCWKRQSHSTAPGVIWQLKRWRSGASTLRAGADVA